MACLTLSLVATVASAGPALADDGSGQALAAPPACFGAAARDAQHPCVNPALARSVTPAPADAILEPNEPCDILGRRGFLFFCAFGVQRAQAVRTAVLLGDSHASHFRAALDVAFDLVNWRGISITRTSCPFSTAVADLPGALRKACAAWNPQVIRWLAKHPTISTVFISQHRGAIVSASKAGGSTFDEQVADYEAAWRRLPASIKHILIIRDVPRVKTSSPTCVSHAVAKHEKPGSVCAEPRSFSLPSDPAAVAVARMHSPRVQLIDLSKYMCSPRLCLPVVGGVLVHKDTNHLTRTFSQTLGPLLLRRLQTLMLTWKDAGQAPAAAPAATPVASAARVAGTPNAHGPSVPILVYHHIAPAPAGERDAGLWIAPDAFTAQLDALSSVGYHVVSLEDVWRAWHGGTALPARPVVLSFDDGYDNQATAAAPALAQRGMSGVLNLQLNRVGVDGGLTAAQVRALIAQGWELDDHTYTHPDLRKVSARQLTREVQTSRTALRKRFGVPVDFFAYPYGRSDARVRATVRAAGFDGATTIHHGLASATGDALALRRIVVGGTWSGQKLLDTLRAAGA